MNIEKGNKIIEESFKEMDKELSQQEEIKQRASELSKKLSISKVVKYSFANDIFTMSRKRKTLPQKTASGKFENIDYIILVVASHRGQTRAKIQNKPYSPAIYKAEYNDEFTLEENMTAVVESFLLHRIGEIKINSQDDGIAKIAREKDMKK